MSIFSGKTGISSILKPYSPAERDKTKNAAFNTVRFEMPKELGIMGAIMGITHSKNYTQCNEFISYIREADLSDNDFKRVIFEARQYVNSLNPSMSNLVEALLSINWINRDDESTLLYTEFYLELLVAHSKHTSLAISKLIAHWVPNENEEEKWPNSIPIESVQKKLKLVHQLLERLLSVIPMTYDIVLDAVQNIFPYYKKPTHVIGGFVHNILWLLEYKPSFSQYMMHFLFQQLLILDVYAPRNLIEDAEFEKMDNGTDINEEIFQMDECNDTITENQTMCHPIAETLDICMDKMFNFLDKWNNTKCNKFESIKNSHNEYDNLSKPLDTIQMFKVILSSFENVLLPSHNTHHVQFLIYYFCSFRSSLAEKFLATLWSKVKDPNTPAPIREATVGYIASFIARSNFVSIKLAKKYIQELCNWAHEYIQRSDSIRSNISLKSNTVFFAICQAVFYVIAFRSRDLTSDKKSLLFLQSLQLSALVTCDFNPLRVCLPAVATTFAGVTRAYQLAYCHTILERNARRKLATVYGNETATPEEVLDTFFPFDPYLLKKSGKRIAPIYLKYQAHEAEEERQPINTLRRKRGDSEMIEDDDFIYIDKKLKVAEISKNDKDIQFTYGLSPGFHI